MKARTVHTQHVDYVKIVQKMEQTYNSLGFIFNVPAPDSNSYILIDISQIQCVIWLVQTSFVWN